jgi:hypothetical protein
MALAVGSAAGAAQSRDGSAYYARANTLGILGAYSWDSSHMLLGSADNRELLNVGISYSRRLWMNHIVNWQYDGELLPVALESDPLVLDTLNWTSPTVMTEKATVAQVGPCVPSSGSFSNVLDGITYSYTYTLTCSRQWTIGEAMSPVGFQWNFLPRHKTQALLEGHGGYMYSTRPIPIDPAGSFNFTFDIGGGFERFLSNSSSMRIEYRYHHLSNHNTATENPGIDNGLIQVVYCFRLGRR